MPEFGPTIERLPMTPQSSIPVFIGYRRQVGGGIFGDFLRSAAPYAKRAFTAVAPTLRKVGKRALKRTVKAATLAVGDAIAGEKSLGEAISARAREQALKALGRAPNQIVAEDAGLSASAIDKPETLKEAEKEMESAGTLQKGSGRKRKRAPTRSRSPSKRRKLSTYKRPKKRAAGKRKQLKKKKQQKTKKRTFRDIFTKHG